MIYADNAATTKISKAALNAMLPCMEENWGNPSSLYAFGQKAAETLQSARERIASCIGDEPGEIYFTSGGSEADNHAILSAAKTVHAKEKTTLSPPPSNTMPACIPWKNWKKKALRWSFWMSTKMGCFPRNRLQTPSGKIPAL